VLFGNCCGETAGGDRGERRITCRRRISSDSASDKKDRRLTCYNWNGHRRATSCYQHTAAVRPVQLLCRQHAADDDHHPSDHHSRVPARRTYSVPSTGRSVVDAVAAVYQRARLQRTGDVDDSVSPPTGYVRVRSFSTSSRGVKNHGDSFKRSHSRTLSLSTAVTNSVNETTSSTQMNDVTGTATAAPAADLTVVVLGDVSVGKRSIISQFTTSEYMHGTSDYSPTAPGTGLAYCTVLCSCSEPAKRV